MHSFQKSNEKVFLHLVLQVLFPFPTLHSASPVPNQSCSPASICPASKHYPMNSSSSQNITPPTSYSTTSAHSTLPLLFLRHGKPAGTIFSSEVFGLEVKESPLCLLQSSGEKPALKQAMGTAVSSLMRWHPAVLRTAVSLGHATSLSNLSPNSNKMSLSF